MIKEAFMWLKENFSGKIIEIDGQKFFSNNNTLIPALPYHAIKPLYSSSLQAITDYLEKHNKHNYCIKINDYRSVELIDLERDERNSYPSLIQCFAEDCPKITGLMGLEKAIQKIIQCTIATEDRNNILGILENIDITQTTELNTTSVMQTICYRKNINFCRGNIENPIKFKMPITFLEIEQPEVNYVLYLTTTGGGNKEKLLASLTESLEVEWKLETMKKIKIFFEKETAELDQKPLILL